MSDRTPVPNRFQDKATDAQVRFISDLLDRKDLFACPQFFDQVNAMDHEEYAAHLKWLKQQMAQVTKKRASGIIDTLLALPEAAQVAREQLAREAAREAAREDEGSPGVSPLPDGHYALEHPEDELNPVRFYRVNRGKDYTARGGRDWSNFTFVDRYVGDDRFPVKGAERESVLRRIAADPLGAAQLYGRESERCCICNRNLTRKLSRELGIGPVCGGRHEWLTDTLVSEARERIIARGEDPDEEVA